MKAKITNSLGKTICVDCPAEEIERLAATPGYRVELISPPQKAPQRERAFFHGDLLHPIARA